MGVIVFIIIGIAICGFCAKDSNRAAEALREQQVIDEAKLKEIRRIEREAKEKARITTKVKREAAKRTKKIKFETMVLDEMKKGRD
jgi:rRNA-processing protein FCF1